MTPGGGQRRPRAVAYLFDCHDPPRSGMHQRYVQVLRALEANGWDVVVALAAHGQAGTVGGRPTHRYTDGSLDEAAKRLSYWSNRLTGRRPDYRSWQWTPPGRRRWFRALVAAHGAELVVVLHAFNGALVPRRRPYAAVLDLPDLETLSHGLWREVEALLGGQTIDPATADDRLATTHPVAVDAAPDPAEPRMIGHFDLALAVSREEADIAGALAGRSVKWAPMTLPPPPLENRYDGLPLIAATSHPFNLHGIVWLARNVLPDVLAAQPDFRLRVVGSGGARLAAVPGLEVAGFVPDLAAAYARAPFVVEPAFLGQGQPFKIVEAMAHGVAPVTTPRGADRSPLTDGVEGLVAATPAAFSESMLSLWRDRERAASLGEAARRRMRDEERADPVAALLRPEVVSRLRPASLRAGRRRSAST